MIHTYTYTYTEDALRLALVHVRHHHSRQLTDCLVELRQSLFVAAQRVERPAQVVVDLSPEDTLHKKKNLKSQCPSILAIENPLSRGLLRVDAEIPLQKFSNLSALVYFL